MSGRDSVFWRGEVTKRRKNQSRAHDKVKNRANNTVKKLTIGQKIRGFNILFPWFKVLAMAMLVMVVVFGVLGVVRHKELAENAELADAEAVLQESAVEKTVDGAAGEEQAKRTGSAYVVSRPEALQNQRLKDKKLIALTFDDGPSPITTPRLLDILQEKKVKATFFVLGRMAQVSPEILKREEREGHAVGSHTMGHVDLTTMDITGVEQDMAVMDGVFNEILGRPVGLVRPPYGAINDVVKAGVEKPLVIWTIDPEDWKFKDAGRTRRHIMERAFDGSIVLLHDIYSQTVDAVEVVIDDLRAAGYEFVTVPEMAKMKNVKLEAGNIYRGF